MRFWTLAFLSFAAEAARVLFAGGDDGIGARRNAFIAGEVNAAGPPDSDSPLLPPPWRKKLQVSNRLAAGAYGTVYKVKVTCGQSSGANLALKVTRPSYSSEKEAKALRQMHGVSDYCSSSVGKPDLIDFQGLHYILIPFMNHGDLYDLLSECLRTPACRCNRQKTFSGLREHPLCWEALGEPYSEAFMLALMLQVMKGVQALHSNHMVHMDLKPENVMIHCKGTHCYAQVVDLGLVCKEHHNCFLSGTPGYIAPEVWQQTDVGIPANDVFSLGVILYAMEMASLPPFGKDANGSLTSIYRPQRDAKLLSRQPAERPMARLIQRMLDPRPKKRISLAEAEKRLREIILSKNVSQAIMDMIEKTPEKAGARVHLPDCLQDGSGTKKLTKLAPLISFLLLLPVIFF